MEGALPPDLQGTLLRIGPRSPWAHHSAGLTREGELEEGLRAEAANPAARPDGDTPSAGEHVEAAPPVGALHAVEIRDGRAVTYRWNESAADATVFWHAGAVLALSETGLPSQYSRLLEPEEFAGALSVPVASHVHRVAPEGNRVLFAVDD